MKNKSNSQKQFWKSQPLDVNCFNDPNIVYDREALLLQIDNNIKQFKFNLEHKELDLNDDTVLTSVTSFVNNCYKENNRHYLIYKKEVVKFFASKEYIALGFYPNKSEKMIGFIIGSRRTLCYNSARYIIKYNAVEVDFLCLNSIFHNMHMSSYIISVLSKKCIEKFNTECAIYTTSESLESKFFTQKNYYHRLISVDTLYEENCDKVKLMKKIYNTFNYSMSFKKKLTYYNAKNTLLEDDNLIDKILINLNNFYKKNSDVYTEKTRDEFINMIQNPYFHLFILNEDDQDSMEAICYFNIDIEDKVTTKLSKDGYLYWYFVSSMKREHVHNVLEYVNEYVYKNKIFDGITLCDPFGFTQKKYEIMKFTKGTGHLNYYVYNLSIPEIEPKRNGLFTI